MTGAPCSGALIQLPNSSPQQNRFVC